MHERILIVDDQQSIQALLSRVCQRAGYEVRVAGDGQTAIDMLEAEAFDIGIFDLVLPDPSVDGIEVLRRAKELYPECQVIIVTGHARLESALEAMRLGAYDYLEKPLPNVHMITMTIERALERQRLAQHNESLIEELRRANVELARRRRQQLRTMNNLGQALVSTLQVEEMTDVLVRALLNTMDIDVAGILLVGREKGTPPQAVVGAQGSPELAGIRTMLDAMLEQLPMSGRPERSSIEVREIHLVSDSPTASDWRSQRVSPLIINDTPIGAVMVASREEWAFDQETLGILSILVNQVSIALENAFLFERMRELATRDSMTKLYNHGHFFELLEAEMSRSDRYDQQLAVIMMDLDRKGGLKQINDTYGHLMGDRLVVHLAETLASTVRREDIIARYGGDEFVVLAPQTDSQQALALANRLAEAIKMRRFDIDGLEQVRCSFSMGVSVYAPKSGQSTNDLVSEADRACYQSKELGGDRICLAPEIAIDQHT